MAMAVRKTVEYRFLPKTGLVGLLAGDASGRTATVRASIVKALRGQLNDSRFVHSLYTARIVDFMDQVQINPGHDEMGTVSAVVGRCNVFGPKPIEEVVNILTKALPPQLSNAEQEMIKDIAANLPRGFEGNRIKFHEPADDPEGIFPQHRRSEINRTKEQVDSMLSNETTGDFPWDLLQTILEKTMA